MNIFINLKQIKKSYPHQSPLITDNPKSMNKFVLFLSILSYPLDMNIPSFFEVLAGVDEL